MTEKVPANPPELRSHVTPVGTSWLAHIIGVTAGASAFALCTLWLGVPVGIVIALVSTLHALARRHEPAALTFVAAGTLAAFALRPSTTLVLVAALVYGAGLALASKRSRVAELLA